MNKHQAKRSIHNKQKYERQKSITAANKRRHILAQMKFAAKQQAKRLHREAVNG